MGLDEKITDFVWNTVAGAKGVADAVDRKAGHIAAQVRGKITGRSPPPPPPPPPPPSLPSTVYHDFAAWVDRNRWTAAAVLGVVGLGGVGAFSLLHHHRLRKPLKRRARRANNGARKEVVVIAGTSGSIHDILTKSLATDLERRGFIVFVVVNSIDDEQAVLNIGGRDIRPLYIDLLDPESAQHTIDKFAANLQSPVVAFQGAAPHHLHFAGMIVVAATADLPSQRSSSSHPTGPVETIAFADWSDTLNLRLLSPFVTMQLFLGALRSSGDARLLVLTPAIISSLAPPFHAPEAAAVAAIDAFSTSLRRELRPLGVHVAQLKLGTFDFTSAGTRGHGQGKKPDTNGWTVGAQYAYGRQFTAQEGVSAERATKGSNLKELYAVVFDSLTEPNPPKLVRVGSGSWIYEVIGRYAPDSLVLWMLGSGKAPQKGDYGVEERGGNISRSASEESMKESMTWEKV